MSNAPTTDLFIELHVPDFDLAEKFYSILGFAVLWSEEKDGGYMVMRRGQSVLNFYGGTDKVFEQKHFKQFPKTTPRGYATEIILLVDDVEAYYEEISSKIDTVVEPLRERPWGQKDFRIVDPFGFYIRVSERYNWLTK